MQALGGAKNHMIVLPDADIDMAADAAVSAGYGSAGERCMAISVVVAVATQPIRSSARSSSGCRRSRSGTGSIRARRWGRSSRASTATRSRPTSTRDRRRARRSSPTAARRRRTKDGFFLGVSLLDDVTPEMDAYRDEIFGPVLSVVRVRTYDEALRLVNENPYGNGVAIFTRDGGVARQFQFDVNVGMVGVNVPIPVPVAYYSFGGWKSSLFGDRHIYGPEGIDFYTRTKAVTSRWPDPKTSKVDLGFPQTR